MAMDLLIVRHGQTDWNLIKKVMGRGEIGLNAKGSEQARNLRDWLKDIPIHAAYSSPQPRAVQTAEVIIEGRNGLILQKEEGLAEIDYGDWVGLTFDEVEQKYSDIFNAYWFQASKVEIPGGETVINVQKRVVAAVEKIRQRHEGQKILIVSHADIIKAMLLHYLGLPLDHLQAVGCDNGSLSVYRFGTDWGDRLVALNYFADVNKILPW